MKKSLTRRERLRNTGEIKALISSGKRIDAEGLKLVYMPNGSGANRMAVVVGRGCGGSVKRNREKRITREAYRNIKPELKAGTDIIFMIRRFGQSYRQRLDSLSLLLLRAGLYGTRR
jgi:ribonuclease P protein component